MKISINYGIIQKYIKNNNLTIREFCKKCNISYYSYRKIIKNEIVRTKIIFNICVILNVGMLDLLEINS